VNIGAVELSMNRDSDLVAARRYAGANFPTKPRLVPWVSLVDLGDERLQFRAADFCYTLHSDLFINLFKSIHPFLNGSHTFEGICSACDKEAPAEVIIFLLKALRDQGLLQEGERLKGFFADREPVADLDKKLNFFSRFVPDSQSILQSLFQAKIRIVGSDDLKFLTQKALVEAGIPNYQCPEPLSVGDNGAELHEEIYQSIQGVDLLVACQETPGHAFFSRVNELCMEAGVRWLRVAIEGVGASIGPTVVPYETACYACYESRREANMEDFKDYREFKERLSGSIENTAEGKLPLFWSLVANHAAMEVVRIISGFAPPKTMGRFFQVTCTSLDVSAHDVLRLPRCPACHPKRPSYETWDR